MADTNLAQKNAPLNILRIKINKIGKAERRYIHRREEHARAYAEALADANIPHRGRARRPVRAGAKGRRRSGARMQGRRAGLTERNPGRTMLERPPCSTRSCYAVQ